MTENRPAKNKSTLTRQTRLDRGIAESLEDVKAGRTYGPFDTAEAMIASLKQHIQERKKANRTESA